MRVPSMRLHKTLLICSISHNTFCVHCTDLFCISVAGLPFLKCDSCSVQFSHSVVSNSLRPHECGKGASQVAVKNLSANAGDSRDSGSIPGSGRSPGRMHGNPLQYSHLKIPFTEEPRGLQSMESQRVSLN